MKKIIYLTVIIISAALWICCSDSDNTSSGSGLPAPGEYSFTLVSASSFTAWTGPFTAIVKENEVSPDKTGEEIKICAASNEYEPFQIAISGNGSISAAFSGFSGIEGGKTSVYTASFSDGMALALKEYSESDSVELSSSKASVFIFDTYIPENTSAGEYTGTISLSANGESEEITVSLTVFDFSLPRAIHFNTHLTASMADLKADGDSGDCEKTKTMLYDNRMILKGGPLWPTGFKYSITWPSGTFTDEPDEGVYGVGYNAEKYLKGEGWDRPGFPLCQAFQFVDNSTPRPETFNGVSIGSDQYGTSDYNTQWKAFLSDLDTYINSQGYADSLYYYVINEPQDSADYDMAAYLCKMTKEAAPHLKIAVSEEPKKEIAENSQYTTSSGESYDIWIADIQHYSQDYAWERQRDYGEEVWFYHNDGTPDPYLNPIDFSKQGLHQRLIPWVSWHYRVTGWAYYNSGIFFSNKGPNIRGILLREGFEDYEYLYLANSSSRPEVYSTRAIDTTVDSVAGSLTSYARNDSAFMDLKWNLGKYIEGSLDEAPVYSVPATREKGDYYINFQDADGSPSASPLTVEGNEYMKIGWDEYDSDKGYGWKGGCVGTSRAMYQYDDVSGYSEIQKSVVYDDYGKINLFEFDLESGTYTVSMGAGRAGRGCYDKHNITVEGTVFLEDYESSEVVEITKEVTVSDGSLSVQIGDAVGQYTFLAYMKIEAKE